MTRSTIPGLEKIEGAKSLTFLALRVCQPIGPFYSAVIPARKLVEVCFFDIRGLSQRDDFADFMGIQRELDDGRVADISRYVRTVDPSFPTAIVISVDERCAEFEVLESDEDGTPKLVRMTLSNFPEPEPGSDPVLYRDIARVIDGQHRIAGLIGFDGLCFDLNVSIFVGVDIATQASIFSTVNLAQTKVNKSLVYDLYSYEKTRSPEKTCHEVASLLDRENRSPFYQRIKRLGVATDGRFGETLSQATFVKWLLPYISRDVLADRDASKRGKPFPTMPDRYREQLFLREFFVTDRDEVIADLMWNYFAAVAEKWEEAWGKTGRGWVLNKTAGYTGLMRFLKPCYYYLRGARGKAPTKQDFARVFEKIEISDAAFRSENIRPGTSGERYVFDLLMSSGALA